MRARLIILLALVLNAAAVAASDVPLPSGNERYIIVFEREAEKSLSEVRDLVKTIGGEVEHALDGWMVVTAPAAAMPKLLEHPAVKYGQPVRTGPAAALSDLPAPRTMAAPDMPIGSHAAQTWSSGDYAYDGAGNIVSIGTSNGPGTQGYRTYGYDKVSRLTRATIGSGSSPPTHEYEYDAYGNRTRYALNNTWVTVPVDDADNRLTDAGYDAAGNETTRGATAATYDGFGMMTSYRFDANNAETFVYTANDERIGVLRGTEWTWSLRDAGGRVLRQYRSSSTSTSAPWLWVEDFVYRNGLLLGSERVAEEGGRRHYHLDHLGTPRLVTGASGSLMSEHDLLPFGEERTMIGQHLARGFDREEPHRFTGHERDFDTSTPNDSSTYIDYMHARFYVARTGRFLSVDPGKDWDQKQPQSWNLYAYTRNNPVVLTDPTGRAILLYNKKTGKVRLGTDADGDGAADELQNGPTQLNQPQCAALKELVRREAQHGQSKAALISSNTAGDQLLAPFAADYGNNPVVNIERMPVDIDWLNDLHAYTGGTGLGIYGYALGKTVWWSYNSVKERLSGRPKERNPPFTELSEMNAIYFAFSGRSYSQLYNPEFLKRCGCE